MLIIVLNDGETFSAATGCTVRSVPDDFTTDQIEQKLEDGELLAAQAFREADNGHLLIEGA